MVVVAGMVVAEARLGPTATAPVAVDPRARIVGLGRRGSRVGSPIMVERPREAEARQQRLGGPRRRVGTGVTRGWFGVGDRRWVGWGW